MSHRLRFVFAAIIASALATTVPAAAVYEAGARLVNSCRVGAHQQPESCNVSHNLEKKQGAYSYGDDVPYLNVTSTSATLTVTVTSTDVLTETIGPSLTATILSTQATDAPLSGYTSMSTAAATAAPSSTNYPETVTISCSCIPAPPIADGQVNPTTVAQSGPDTAANTVTSSTCSCESTPLPSERCSSSQVVWSTTVPYVIVTTTTTIVYSASSCEEYTGTDTVTMTPYVTITKSTTKILSSVTETSTDGNTITQTKNSVSTATVTIYLSQLPTQEQTGTVRPSASAVNVTFSELVTATVVQTISPIPSRPLTTKHTASSMINSPSTITRRSTLTITISATSVLSTIDISPAATTLRTSTSVTEIISRTVTTGSSVDTTCTKSSKASSNTSIFTTTTAVLTPAPSASYFVSISIHGSVRTANATSATNSATVPASGSITAKSVTKHIVATYTPKIHQPGSTMPTSRVNATVPISAGEPLGKKRPVKLSWGDTDGTYSQTCVILLAMVISLLL